MKNTLEWGRPLPLTDPRDPPPGEKVIVSEAVAFGRDLDRYLAQVDEALNATYRKVLDVQTTDATATKIYEETVPASSAWSVELDITGYATTGDVAAYRRLVRAKRIGTAAPSILGTDVIGTDREDDGTWNVAAAISGNDLQVTVTGAAGKTIEWTCRVMLQQAPRPKLPAS